MALDSVGLIGIESDQVSVQVSDVSESELKSIKILNGIGVGLKGRRNLAMAPIIESIIESVGVQSILIGRKNESAETRDRWEIWRGEVVEKCGQNGVSEEAETPRDWAQPPHCQLALMPHEAV